MNTSQVMSHEVDRFTPRALGLAPLSTLGRTPHEVVESAAAAGFDYIGLRLPRPTHSDTPLITDPTEIARVLDALAATGITVEEVDGLRLDPGCRRSTWLEMLDTAAALGARTFTVTCSDPDRERLLDTLAAFTLDALDAGIVPAVQPVVGYGVADLTDATDLAREVGCLVLPDTVHHHYSGTTADQAATAAELAVALQICDLAPIALNAALADDVAAQDCRVFPGDGEVDLAGFLGLFPATLPTSVAMSAPPPDADLTDYLRQLFITGRACVDAATLTQALPAPGLV